MTLQHVAGKNKGRIVLYALSTCPWCKKTKKLLDDLGVEYYFGDVDLMSDTEKKEALQVIKKWNSSTSFPTMVIDDDRCIIGFQENKIKEEFSK
jgi:glutaredoxin-like protein NrdH